MFHRAIVSGLQATRRNLHCLGKQPGHRLLHHNTSAVLQHSAVLQQRWLSASRRVHKETPFSELSEEDQATLSEERAADNVDVCIVGGGPAGLATAIRLKQLDNAEGSGDMRVVVLEKAADFGSHMVSGAVIEPRALRELFPDLEHYDEQGNGIPLPADLATLGVHDEMKYLTRQYAFSLPEPPQMKNEGRNYIVSLNQMVAYLAEQAAELGVETYPGISVSELVYTADGKAVKGVATKDVGVGRDGAPKASFERGMEFHARVTVLGEGCHGSLSKKAIARYNLRQDADPQTYGLGIKEVWRVREENFQRGFIGHTLGFPLSMDTYGGGFMYHFGDGLVAVGIVVGLDYANPYISPYLEFQKMKTHPYYANVLEGGECVSYAARALNEGGYQSIPKLHFPGGILVGCSAGFINLPKIKGTHTAMKSGMVAAELIFAELKDVDVVDEDSDMDSPLDLALYEHAFKQSWAYEELYQVRNVRPAFNVLPGPLGFLSGLAHSGLTTMVTHGAEPWTLSTTHTDAEATRPAKHYAPIDYPKPDGKLTFDILTSVSRTGTYHQEDEPCHLRIPGQDHRKHAEKNWEQFRGVEQRFCPAGVYEYVEDETEPLGVKFNINSQNCIHCKTCDIKVPSQDIDWEVPEGGDGPKYYMS